MVKMFQDGNHANMLKLLDTCTLYLQLLWNAFIFDFCLLK